MYYQPGLQGDLDGLEADVATLQTDVAANTGDIATNTANIATNTGDIAAATADITTLTGDVTTHTSQIGNLTTQIANLQGGEINLFSAHATGGLTATAVGVGAVVDVPLTALVIGDQLPDGSWTITGGVLAYTAPLAGLYEVQCVFAFSTDLAAPTVYTCDVVEGTGLDTGSPTVRSTISASVERALTAVDATIQTIGLMRLNAGAGQLAVRVSHASGGTATVDATAILIPHRVSPP